MRLFVIRAAAASLLIAAPAAALPGFDKLQISLEGQAQGWLQATCNYYGLGWLEPDKATQSLRRLVLLIGKDLGHQAAVEAKAAALKRDPGCQSVWPDSL